MINGNENNYLQANKLNNFHVRIKPFEKRLQISMKERDNEIAWL